MRSTVRQQHQQRLRELCVPADKARQIIRQFFSIRRRRVVEHHRNAASQAWRIALRTNSRGLSSRRRHRDR
jgi:hypothetical protein